VTSYRCPICGHVPEQEECSHFLCEIDATFNEVYGISAFEDFLDLAKNSQGRFTDRYEFTKWLISTLSAAGAQKALRSDLEEDASSPGFTSATTIFYADDPDSIVRHCTNIIKLNG